MRWGVNDIEVSEGRNYYMMLMRVEVNDICS